MRGSIFDLPVAMEIPKIAVPEGFRITGGEVVYSGYCPECAGEDDANQN